MLLRWRCSCAPNAAPDPIDPTRIVCVAPISTGDEVTLSYFGVQSLEAKDRKDFLRERFGFECGCELCIDRAELDITEVQARLNILTSLLEQQHDRR